MKERIEVVAAFIINRNNEFLICKRPMNKLNPGLWEFPGGKVEAGESKNQALIRECQEELGILIEPNNLLLEIDYDYPELKVHLNLIRAKIIKGTPVLKEHLDYKWIKVNETGLYKFCPADYLFLNDLKNFLPES